MWFAVLLVATLAAVVSIDSEADGEGSFSAYNALNEVQQQAYDSMLQLAEELGERCDIEGLTEDEAYKAYIAVQSDHPEMFWFQQYYVENDRDTGMAVSFMQKSYARLDNIDQKKAELEEAAESIQIKGETEADRIRSIHDAVAFSTRYAGSPLSDSSYGALVSGLSVDLGYANAFNYLCERNGIVSALFVLKKEDLAYYRFMNQVLLDGAWYLVDVKEDDVPCPNCAVYRSFLKCQKDLPLSDAWKETEPYASFGNEISDASYPYDPYAGPIVTYASGINYGPLSRIEGDCILEIGEFKAIIRQYNVKDFLAAMDEKNSLNLGIAITRSPIGDIEGLKNPFICTVLICFDDEPVSLKKLGLSSTIAIRVPELGNPDYHAVAYWLGAQISIDEEFYPRDNGGYLIGYSDENTELPLPPHSYPEDETQDETPEAAQAETPAWAYYAAIVLLVLVAIAIGIWMVFRKRGEKTPSEKVPDYDGEPIVRRFDRDCVCPECGYVNEPDAKFCPNCGRKF